jgi:hypothetical protein
MNNFHFLYVTKKLKLIFYNKNKVLICRIYSVIKHKRKLALRTLIVNITLRLR